MAQGLGAIIRAQLDDLAALRQRQVASNAAELARIDTRIAELTAAADLLRKDITVEPIVTSLVELKALNR